MSRPYQKHTLHFTSNKPIPKEVTQAITDSFMLAYPDLTEFEVSVEHISSEDRDRDIDEAGLKDPKTDPLNKNPLRKNKK